MPRTSIWIAAFVALGACAVFAQQSTMPAMPMKTMPAKTMSAAETQRKIQQAMRAAPPEIATKATIMDFPEDGMPMPTLRAGTNGWTCLPSSHEPAKNPSQQDPMCVDKGFMSLMDAWMAKGDPKLTSVAVGYMLLGDKGASNTDPYSMTETPTNNWVVSPPHIMIAVPDRKQLDVFPSDPHAGGPWVMWKGTKYAHLMVPIAAMPKMSMTH